jgi:hypothetical protein
MEEDKLMKEKWEAKEVVLKEGEYNAVAAKGVVVLSMNLKSAIPTHAKIVTNETAIDQATVNVFCGLLNLDHVRG